MIVLTSDTHMKSFLKVFHHSHLYIMWNSDNFFTVGLFQIRKHHRDANQESEEAMQRLPVRISDDQKTFLAKWLKNVGR